MNEVNVRIFDYANRTDVTVHAKLYVATTTLAVCNTNCAGGMEYTIPQGQLVYAWHEKTPDDKTTVSIIPPWTTTTFLQSPPKHAYRPTSRDDIIRGAILEIVPHPDKGEPRPGVVVNVVKWKE